LALALLALVVAGIVIAQGGGGGKGPTGCLILDVSESTAEARSRYPDEFRAFALALAEEGTGDVCLIRAGKDPIAEGAPVFTSVAPTPGNLGKPKGVEEIEKNVETATAEITALGEDPGVREGGSGLVEAATVAAETLDPGDEILFLSDGLQWSRAGGHLMKMDLSAAGISRHIQTLEDRDLVPDLEGVKVYFPLILYHPESFHGHFVEAQRVKTFWEAWARAAGAEIVFSPVK
jgi:hypothetical protein